MCNTIFVSTDSEQDLSTIVSEHFHFERLPSGDAERISRASYKNVWKLWRVIPGVGNVRACYFRHLIGESINLDFGEPQEWYPESEDDVVATQAVYDVFAALVTQGHHVEVMDLWNDEMPPQLDNVLVRMDQVSREAFRFWEGSRFNLVR